ncbi:siderophore-interacting protein [Citrobacter portucalensis]|uniref:siderophore-interacting protein n=2 Tax=Gammaproteobacteria TaxID=1236 RepID=UPI000C56BB37|nr:siderophore-interacting protein [Citrobacter portucalensis]PIA06114.1 NADPH-dependent ferric siderophore reductase [Enterobacter cloacae]
MNESRISVSQPEHTPVTPDKRAGRLETAMQKLFMRSAQVTAVEPLGERFRLITLSGDALKQMKWTPGDKIQLQLGGWVQRTYTPIDWNPLLGSTRILAYLHGDGPGADWARYLCPGDECVFFGPRGSIDLTKITSPAFVFGDETSIGLMAALHSRTSTQDGPITYVLETASFDNTQVAIRALGLGGLQIIERQADGAHRVKIEALADKLQQTSLSATFVLTGNAASIQPVRQFLRQRGIKASRFQNKAYWAAGKKGLD